METLKDYLKSIGACGSAVDWAGDKIIEQVVAECHRGDWLLWLGQKCGVELQPLILAKGHCANTVRHLMTDERSVNAVDMAIAFGEGRATADELNATHDAHAAHAASSDSYADHAAHIASAASAAHDACADYVAYAAAHAAAHTIAYASDDAYAVTYAAEFNVIQMQAADICRKYIGELIIEKITQILNPNKP